MAALLYIHGFLSSPKSQKAIQMGEWLLVNRPQVRYLCPFLTAYPDQTLTTLEQLVEQFDNPGPLYLVGSSLGGFWATLLAERYDLRTVLINPAVDLRMSRETYINTPLQNYHTEDTYILREEHITAFKSAEVAVIRRPSNYLLMVQTGDEVLDYRLAVQKYAGCRQIIEPGGDHSFQHFENHIPGIMAFLESTA